MPKMPNINDDSLAAVDRVEQSTRKANFPTQKPGHKDPPQRGLSVRVMRHYGAIDIEFGVSVQYNPVDTSDQQRRFYQLYDEIDEMHTEWAKTELPKLQNLNPQDKQVTSDNRDITRYEAVEVYKQHTDRGETRYKIRTTDPRYSKYGLTCYPEIVEKYGLDVLLHDREQADYSGHIIHVEKRGQSLAVVRIERATK